MPLRRAFVGCRVIETAENYARADAPLLDRPAESRQEHGRGYYDDREFWHSILSDPDASWGASVSIDPVAFSEWVARVPGLYWRPDSERLRQLSPEAVEYQSQAWITFRPWGKSQKVMGGIGTLRLPPAQDGYRLATLTTTCNVSAGVPALVSPEVWEHHRLGEGVVLGGQARWQPMARGWSSLFPSTRGVPRGTLVMDQPDDIRVFEADNRVPTVIHPFTIMEYYQGGLELFDYVYAAADTGEAGHRDRLERFFDAYKDRHDRFGRYLLAGDAVNPLWDAQFEGPEDLRRADPSAGSQLSLLEARVRERHLGEELTENLLEALSAICDTADDVRRLSDEAGIPPAVWFAGGTVAEVSSQLVSAALERDRLAALVEVMAAQYPELFQEKEA